MALYGGNVIASLTGGLLYDSIITIPSGHPVGSNLGVRMYHKAEILINRYGTVANLWNGVFDYDPTTRKKVVAEEIQQDKRIIPPYPFEHALVDGDMIRSTDMQTGVAAKYLAITIDEQLQITTMGHVYQCVRYWPIVSNDVIILYLIQLRR
jgi:hypothetical protein